MNSQKNTIKVSIMEPLGITHDALAALQAPFERQGVVFQSFEKTTDPEKLKEEARDADVMILANMPMPADVLRACPKLRFIDIAFTGVDHVGLEAARQRGITVSNASGYSDEAVAELVLGMALSLARNLRAVEDRCRSGGTKAGLIGWELKGKTVGIVGLGRIGLRTAELFRAFGCSILASSKTVHGDAPSWVEQTTLDSLLERADIVTLHCPLNDSTRGLIDAEKLSRMKRSALLINAARGGVVDSAALVAALEAGTIAGAAVDVFAVEPPLNADEPLLGAPHTLLTPHVAFATEESMLLRAQIVFDNLKNWLDGRPSNVIQ